jgi:hypothetical protein
MELFEESIVPEHARDVKREARAFAEEQIAPNAAEYYASGDYPWEVLEAGMEADLVAGDISPEYGGRGWGVEELLAIAEEFYRADAGIALTLQLASFGAKIVEEAGSERLCEEYLRPVAENEQLTGLAVSEPETGSDLSGMETTARLDGDEWVVDGEKYWIGNGVEADWVTMYVRTEDGDNPYQNYSLLVVPTDAPGYEAEHIPEKMGFRASKQAHVTLDGCRVPAENLVGERGAGFGYLLDFFNHGRVVVGGHGLGLAAAAIEEAWEFAHDRDAWGQPVAGFQSVQHILADMRTAFESARALNWRAAEKVAAGDRPGFWASMAKVRSTETAVDCAERGMQLHGGRSVLADRRISRVYRDCRIPVIYEGANEIQRNLIYGQQA